MFPPDKALALQETFRVLKPGTDQFANYVIILHTNFCFNAPT